MKTAADFIRPSALHDIAACPGRPTMEAAFVNRYGEPESSPEASMGTRAHAFVTQGIEQWKLCQETGERGASWGDAIADACNAAQQDGLDAWTVRNIQFCLETARDLIAKYDIEVDNVLTEHRLGMEDQGMDGGTADLLLVQPFKRVIGCDWKFTFMDQGEADEHDQLQSYASASAATFSVPEVIVYLVAPRADKPRRITAATFDAATLRANVAWTQAVVARASGPNPELVPRYAQCLYCRALATCPAARGYIMDANEALAVIGEPLDGTGYAGLIDAAKLAEKFAETGKEMGKAHLLAGNHVPGWKLGTPRATRSVVDVPAALAELEAAGIRAVDLALADALSIKVSNLPDAAEAVIVNRITDKLSSPPLTQDKSTRVAA